MQTAVPVSRICFHHPRFCSHCGASTRVGTAAGAEQGALLSWARPSTGLLWGPSPNPQHRTKQAELLLCHLTEVKVIINLQHKFKSPLKKRRLCLLCLCKSRLGHTAVPPGHAGRPRGRRRGRAGKGREGSRRSRRRSRPPARPQSRPRGHCHCPCHCHCRRRPAPPRPRHSRAAAVRNIAPGPPPPPGPAPPLPFRRHNRVRGAGPGQLGRAGRAAPPGGGAGGAPVPCLCVCVSVCDRACGRARGRIQHNLRPAGRGT